MLRRLQVCAEKQKNIQFNAFISVEADLTYTNDFIISRLQLFANITEIEDNIFEVRVI